MGKASIQSALKLGTDKHIIKGHNDLREVILAKSTVDGGWLFRHFNDKSAPENEAFIYLRAVLSQQCLENSDLTRALTMAVLDSDTFPIDNHFLMSIHTTYATSEKNQKGEEHMFVWLIDGFENPGNVLAKLRKRNLEEEAGWM
jgi:hypothetical protein